MNTKEKGWTRRPWDGSAGFAAALDDRPKGSRLHLARLAVEISRVYADMRLSAYTGEEREERRRNFRDAYYSQALALNGLRPDHLGGSE
jgi:hypothetical protein